MKFTKDHETVLETDQEYINAYLTWKNDFLTVDCFAQYYGWNRETAIMIIEEGRELHNETTK